jgi:hypothetical protein
MLGRLIGALYLYIIVAAMFAEAFVRGKLVVTGDAAATVRNIASSETLWRWGIAANVSTTVCDVAVAALLFVLLRPVSRTLSVGAASMRLAYSAAMAANAALLIVPVLLIGDTPVGAASAPSQIQALTMYSLRLHAAGFAVALVFFGVHLVLTGVLITRSTFLPRWLGVALMIAGLCYLANSFIGFVAPALASPLFPWILLPGFLAEASLTLWLLFASVNPERWALANRSGDN